MPKVCGEEAHKTQRTTHTPQMSLPDSSAELAQKGRLLPSEPAMKFG
jgi:hypothetical protein